VTRDSSIALELGPIAVLAALDFHELGYQRPTTAVEVSLDGLALRFEAKARFALLISRNPVVSDEFAPVRRHCGKWGLVATGAPLMFSFRSARKNSVLSRRTAGMRADN
jgi:hypothetical protein